MAYYAGSLFDTEQQALEASIYDYVTGCGKIFIRDALEHATSGRQDSINDARSDGWAYAAEDVDGQYEWNRDVESWGVHRGGSVKGEPSDFDDDDIERAFDAVADELRAEIADGEDGES